MEQIRKHSRKRDAILNCVRSTACHPTAEWVYEQLKPEIPDLSLGTVYRNLALFRESGEIISVGCVNGQERYDGNTRPHVHFVCTCCGKVDDLPEMKLPEQLLSQAEEQTGGSLSGWILHWQGICKNCRKPSAL